MRTLIVYYSQSQGNTKRIAEMIQKKTGADIVQIDTVTPYPESYDGTVQQGQNEVKSGFMPKIKPLAVTPADYDSFIIGTPTWWYTMAPAVSTFLNSTNFSGKTVAFFQTHGGWPGHTFKDMKKACPGAVFQSELAVRFDSSGGSRLETAPQEIERWIQALQS